MEISESSHEGYLAKAKELVAQLEEGRWNEATTALDSLTQLRESDLFQELGKLTRELHDTLANFQVDSHLSHLTETEIPDAKERLNHVITMTEQAADRTLSVVEETLPRTEQLEKRAIDLKRQWDRFRNRDMKVEEFRGLSNEIDEFLAWTSDNATAIHGGLSEVMMAQDFQDLTGQIIKRVIKLVQEVEESLVGLIRITGRALQQETVIQEKKEAKEQKPDIKAEGPAVPGVDDDPQVMAGQDDVDELLSSLGF